MRNHYLPELFLKIIFILNTPAKCLSFFMQFEVIFKWQKIYLHPTVWVTGWSYMRNNAEVKWSEVAQSCPTLCNPMDCSLPGFSIHGIFQASVLEWVAISFSRGSCWPRNRTGASCIAGRCFTLLATRELFIFSFFLHFLCISVHIHLVRYVFYVIFILRFVSS